MLAQEHRDFQEERKHLEEILAWVMEERDFLENYEEGLKKQILEIRKTVTHLMDERLLAKQQLHKITARNVENLHKAQETPYFGRIDFQEGWREDIENIYIGKYGLHDKDNEIPLVVDWRAPIADVYYSGHSKDVSYRAPSGEITGKLHLKRRFDIKKGDLKEIFDDQTSEDRIEDSLKGKGEFLTEALNKTTQGRLKEIVATIQDQQNKIIRSEMIKPLVVQGVAGSGKTTIALHRMAYLIYNNRRNTDANYMVVAPNKLFLNYISDILPDLGVDNVYQTTFEEWALSLLKVKIKLSNTTDQLNVLMQQNNPLAKTIITVARIKGSLLFKKVIDNLIKQLERRILPQEGIVLEGIPLLTRDKLLEIFLTSNLHLSMQQRLVKLQNYVKVRLKNELPDIELKVEIIYKNIIQQLKSSVEDIESIRGEIIKTYDERDQVLIRIRQQLNSTVDKYFAEIKTPNTIEYYRSIFSDPVELSKAFGERLGSVYETALKHVREVLGNNAFELDDLAPLAYIHIKLYGLDEKNKYTHIVVDEAQDFDEFRISVLRELSMNDSFTFVGDLSQGIYSYKGVKNWNKTMERVFPNKDYQYHVLTTSYRSTIEIVELANKAIEKCRGLEAVLAEPVFRHGERPVIYRCRDKADMQKRAIEKIEAFKGEGYSSIAIICKDMATTEGVYKVLKKHTQIHLITDKVTDYQGGVVVIPSYLSKGLEFDGVILWAVDKEIYTMEDLDIKLFFIGITRALHKVTMLYEGDYTEILEGLDSSFNVK